MAKFLYFWIAGFYLPLSLAAAERKFDFSGVPENQNPPGFRSVVTGLGKPGEWKVVLDDASSALPAPSQSRGVNKRAVLAQVSQDPTDEHFPLLIFDQETYSDFSLSTRFKTVRGTVEQMAGIAFRVQNETNYYVVRASSLGNTFRFYEVINGVRGAIVGPEVPISSNEWHEMSVDCKGGQIRCSLEGKELISITDKANRFTSGKIGFWTKSDSVTYFADTRIVYTPRENPAQAIVRETLKKYPKLLDLKIYVSAGEPNTSKVIASREQPDLGQPGGGPESAVMRGEGVYYGKDKGIVSVIMPLRDRNGDSVAAARVTMKSFPGQTEQNVLARATPIIKSVQAQVQSLQDLID